VVLASGIGHPGGFEDLALRLGLSVAASWRFPDHHHFSQDETDALATQGTLIVTGKDAVKLAALPRPPAAWVLEADHAVADAQPLERLMAQVLART
jgi:tetraacyldisaccharide-1-P 4'-kinase